MRVSLFLSVAYVLIPGISLAQGQPSEEAASDARAVFSTALADFEAGRFEEALRRFAHVYRSAPAADLWFNIGRCHEELGQAAQAIQAFERYLRDKAGAPDGNAVRARISRLGSVERPRRGSSPDAALGSVRVVGAQPGALVLLDGEVLGGPSSEAGSTAGVTSGPHRLDVMLGGHIPFHAEVQVAAATQSEARVGNRPLADSSDGSRNSTWFTLAATVSGVALAVAAALAIASDARAGVDSTTVLLDQGARIALAGGALTGAGAVTIYLSD